MELNAMINVRVSPFLLGSRTVSPLKVARMSPLPVGHGTVRTLNAAPLIAFLAFGGKTVRGKKSVIPRPEMEKALSRSAVSCTHLFRKCFILSEHFRRSVYTYCAPLNNCLF
jgi:hypothetical protein